MNGKKIEVDYGKSMYGGWYANYIYLGLYTGCNAKTKKALIQKLNSIIGYNAWVFTTRFDNDKNMF